MNKNNKVYVAKIEKKINNNEKTYSTLNKLDINENNTKKDDRNINQKINDIFNSKKYVYKADVVISTMSGKLKKRVIGRNSKYLITDKNELFLIDEIKDIEYQ